MHDRQSVDGVLRKTVHFAVVSPSRASLRHDIADEAALEEDGHEANKEEGSNEDDDDDGHGWVELRVIIRRVVERRRVYRRISRHLPIWFLNVAISNLNRLL